MSEDENKIEMTEGEAIELLKEYVAYTKQARSPYETDKATEMLLDLYKQEKEKIEAMNKGIDELTREKQDLKTELYMNSVSKDKIRELLKVIQKEKDIATKNILEKDYNLAENGAICQELGYIEGKLKELLEEE